jgi:hypothetical protein
MELTENSMSAESVNDNSELTSQQYIQSHSSQLSSTSLQEHVNEKIQSLKQRRIQTPPLSPSSSSPLPSPSTTSRINSQWYAITHSLKFVKGQFFLIF